MIPPPSDDAGRSRPRVQSAARAIRVLQAVARNGGGGLSAKELSEQLALPRQVVYHLVHTLVSLDMLRKARGSRYVLGLGVGMLAQGFRRQLMAPDFLGRYVDAAAARTGETAYAVGWLDGRIVVLATARGGLPVHAAEIPHGFADDAHARASGKLLLAMAPQTEIDRYLARHPLTARTANTLTTPTALHRELARIRTQWIGIEREEFAPGLACVAVPIGPVPAVLVLGISAPLQRLDEHLEAYVRALREVIDNQRDG
ncbi:MAG: IclR family transcriptional regulator [Gammaproteobacteria bacterium]|nr:IclR family transcriptional regulator [Gammaproteobacteria bacterium]